MTGRAWLFTCLVAVGAGVLPLVERPGVPQHAPAPRITFHNRILLNRAAVAKLPAIDILVLARCSVVAVAAEAHGSCWDAVAEVRRTAVRLGGSVARIEPGIGYLLLSIAPDRVLRLSDEAPIAAWQIASLSRGTWYRDGPPWSTAAMFRGREASPIVPAPANDTLQVLPELTADAARSPGYTGAREAGLDAWYERHPTYDGRGTTIAVIENGLPHFAHASLQPALALDGSPVPKIVGLVNAIPDHQPDETRVRLDVDVEATSAWHRIDDRTYEMPAPGTYRFGRFTMPAGGHLRHEFGVLASTTSAEVWIDADGDASFRDETPVPDVNVRFEPRTLHLIRPAKLDVSFVMGRRDARTVHVYVGRSGHHSMTIGVAAGARVPGSLASGVAPNARVLIVRENYLQGGLPGYAAAFIAAAAHPDVDVVSASLGVKFLPDTGDAFSAVFFDRLVAHYRKPIVLSAGNEPLLVGSTLAAGAAWTVGGTLHPETFAAFSGGCRLPRQTAHRASAAGPSLDARIKPDFLAPVERLALRLPWDGAIAVPRNAPVARVPRGYDVSCCTSSSAPAAAGITALLISAARQAGVPFDVSRLHHALTTSARVLDGVPMQEQGHGAMDVNAAWRALQDAATLPRIVASGRVVHPLAEYAPEGPHGQGIFEFSGWTAGIRGVRHLELQRETGPRDPVEYALTWTGNSGTFSVPRSVTLPLGPRVRVPVDVHVRANGTHSAILNVVDRASGRAALRTTVTVVASERFGRSGTIEAGGSVPFMDHVQHYFTVPPGTSALAFDLDVREGALKPAIVPPHGLFPSYYSHRHPITVRYLGAGRHTVVIPDPEPGTWTVQLLNASADVRGFYDEVPAHFGSASYAMTIRALAATIVARAGALLTADVEVTGARPRAPVLSATSGSVRRHQGSLPTDGVPALVELEVPPETGSMSLRLSAEASTGGADLYLYDCTTGECFSYDIAFPFAASHSITVRRPAPGRWVAAVTPAPFARAGGRFVLEDVQTSGPATRAALQGSVGAWKDVSMPWPSVAAARPQRTSVVLVELLDTSLDEDERRQAWVPGPNAPVLRDRPVALGVAIVQR